MLNFDPMILLDLGCYAVAAVIVVATFRALDYAEGRRGGDSRRGRHLTTPEWTAQPRQNVARAEAT